MLFVNDFAHVFSPVTIAHVDAQIAAMRDQTGEELVVVTTPSLPGTGSATAVEEEAWNAFAERGIHGALLYVDRDDRRDALVAQPDAWFPPAEITRLQQSLDRAFGAGEYDVGLERLTASLYAVYREHAAPERAKSAAPRLRIYGLIAAALLSYLLVRGALRREGG